MKREEFLSQKGVYYPRVLKDIKKSDEPLSPLFEAFTNALESITMLPQKNGSEKIDIKLYHLKGTTGQDLLFNKIVIEDTGIGFNEDNFERLQRFKDDRKGYNNKGSGRIQFLHFFETSEFKSIYEHEGKFFKRQFVLSKSKPFLKNEAIIKNVGNEISDSNATGTVLEFKVLLDKHDESFFNKLEIDNLKKKIIGHYTLYFCAHSQSLPQITLYEYLNNKLEKTLVISFEDLPKVDKEKEIVLRYSKLTSDGKDILKTSREEKFCLKSFKIDKNSLEKNEIKLTSKGEIADSPSVNLESLSPNESIDNNRYLFLLSGEYLNNKDGDTRGALAIPSISDFKKNIGEQTEIHFEEEEILLGDIAEVTNKEVLSIYEEIRKNKEQQELSIEQLKNMFLLDGNTLKSLSISLNDSEEKILEKVYKEDAKIIAQKDAEIKKRIDALDKLDPSDASSYSETLNKEVTELVKKIPLQNRTALAHYVARRKLVLELFGKILDKELDKLKTHGRIDEDLLHNLIFQQHSDKPEESDLWLINEEFIYFKGVSENQLGNIELDGDKILKEELTEEEEKYRLKQKGDAKQKRTDILLFPKEGKCIIIELKAPDINISEHLNQINRYASLINNLSKDTYKFDTFYGYLIGENIDIDDIEDNDTDFKSAHSLGFIFRPHKRIAGKFGKTDGALYTEIIKYSTLLKRAKERNEIFIKKLTK